MPNLETRTAYVVGFWRPPQEPEDVGAKLRALVGWMQENAETFACIIHGLDVNEETGERVTTHIHFVFKARSCRRLGTILNEIAQTLAVDNLTISVDKCSSVGQSLRYLVHKDDPQKHQYSFGDVIHNWPAVEFEKVMAGHSKESIDFDTLIALIRRSLTITDVIAVIGIGTYRYWRPVITDMWRDVHKG